MNTTTAEMNRPIRSPNGKTVRVPVVFLELTKSTPQSVCIAGTFNDWRPEVTRMIHMGDGCWGKELSLPPGNYEYRLVVDGEWIPDPWADDHVPNPFGGINSVLTVSAPPPRPAGHRPGAERAVETVL